MTTAASPASVVTSSSLPRWYSHRFNRVAVYRAAAAVASTLPRWARLRLAAELGSLAALALPRERARVEANLARVRPDLTPPARAVLARDVFRHFAICFADLVVANRQRQLPERLLAAIRGSEYLDEAGAARRGLVVLTAHLGNWEFAGRLLAHRAPRPTHVVVAPEADAAVERFLRGAPGAVNFVTRREPRSVLPLMGALRRGEMVAMQGDRGLGNRGDVAMPFFGAPAPLRRSGATSTPSGPGCSRARAGSRRSSGSRSAISASSEAERSRSCRRAARAPAGAAHRACCARPPMIFAPARRWPPPARGSASWWARRWGASRRSRTRSVVRGHCARRPPGSTTVPRTRWPAISAR